MIGRMRVLHGAETNTDRTSEAQFVVEEVTDPVEIARFRAQDERFRRNSDWLAAHWDDVLPQARGRFLAVAGQEPFIADSPEDAAAMAKAAYPDDTGLLVRYVRSVVGPRIYAHRRQVAAL
jgi:hypothetical protein